MGIYYNMYDQIISFSSSVLHSLCMCYPAGSCQFANLDMTAGMYLDPEGKLHHKAEVSPSIRRFNSLQRGDSKLKVT